MKKFIESRINTDHSDIEEAKRRVVTGMASTMVRELTIEQVSKLFKLESNIVNVPIVDSEATKEFIVFRLTYEDETTAPKQHDRGNIYHRMGVKPPPDNE